MVSYILETFWSGVQGYQRRGLHGLRTVERSVENRELSRETLPKVQWIRRVCSPWTFAAPGCLVLSDVSPSSFSICSGKQIGRSAILIQSWGPGGKQAGGLRTCTRKCWREGQWSYWGPKDGRALVDGEKVQRGRTSVWREWWLRDLSGRHCGHKRAV